MRQPEVETRICQFCPKPFVPKRSWQKYCSSACSDKAYQKRNPTARRKASQMPVTGHFERRRVLGEASGRWGDCMRFLAELNPALILRIRETPIGPARQAPMEEGNEQSRLSA